MKKLIFIALSMLFIQSTQAQSFRWQQRADYKMDIDFDHTKHQYKGKQVITYTNNAPEALTKVYYHLYFNAFQPGSSMDYRSRNIEDADPRVADRIYNLKEDEIGYMHVKSLKVDGKEVKFFENETILEVTLNKPLASGSKAVFEMEFDGQVPIQIRRSGRNSAEGIDYSMTQWYPKMCQYDERGWHANPYIGREFYGIWGEFEVNLTIDAKYIVAGTGILQNPTEIGYGYAEESKVKRLKGDKLTWKFKAPNVHDFAWAADPDYVHETIKVDNSYITLRFFYQKDQPYSQAWKDLQPLAAKGFDHLNKNFGVYPYTEYSIIQGGDGGMEYPMATLITGNRKLPSLTGVTIHEAAHSWFQGVLGFDESHYYWMDEGFTSFATSEVMDMLFQTSTSGEPHKGAYRGYYGIVEEGKEEALDTHADHFVTNDAYSTAAYNKGQVYLAQLEYVVGTFAFRSAMLDFYNTWKFKHPNANDFLRIVEKHSGMELDWYNEYFVNSTKTIDYALSGMMNEDNNTYVLIKRKGLMPMPVDLEVNYMDNTKEMFHIPLDIMRGEKPANGYKGKWTVLEDWSWVKESYLVEVPGDAKSIKSITIDPSYRMADIDRSNNELTLGGDMRLFFSNE
jgi:hypothetical protein